MIGNIKTVIKSVLGGALPPQNPSDEEESRSLRLLTVRNLGRCVVAEILAEFLLPRHTVSAARHQ